MTGIASRLAQTWPRIVISLINFPLLMNFPWVLGRAQDDFTSTFMAIVINATRITLIAYAVIRKSLIATRILYAEWWILTALFLLILLVVIPVQLYMYFTFILSEAEEIWAEYSVSALRDVVLSAVQGWAYAVHIRDLRGQRRDAWGRLVQDYVMLETKDEKDTAV
ncbi:hypothetical protein BGX34_009196 [Mortierella sp. NVP85]|nr:hypothetical protein BGX34_009196 [Mortierella sp. NVP85]